MENKVELKNLVKDRTVIFDRYKDGTMYYTVATEDATYRFPVPLDDIGTATLLATDKALLFMRYIRKAIDNNELQTV